jgi:ADP-heptose:LPS heptosyltransferase
MRYLRNEVYPDRKFLLFINPNLHAFVHDFVTYTIDLPEWFYKLGLDVDCNEAVLPNSPPASLTPPDVYAGLIKEIRKLYNPSKAIEAFAPRGCNKWVDKEPQMFCKFETEPIQSDKPIIVIMPRKRPRAANRNVPEFVWFQVVEHLKKNNFQVVLAGTPNGSALSDYNDPDVVNLIPYNKEDKTELILRYLNSAVCSLSSQSGTTHMSLLCNCPSVIIGHEKDRHTKSGHENRLDTPTCFRFVYDYRAIDEYTILTDTQNFLNKLQEAGWFETKEEDVDYDEIIKADSQKLVELLR